MYQIVRVPNYDHQANQTGRTLQADADAGAGTLDLDSATGFAANQFALLGWDSELENKELVQVSGIDGTDIDVSATSYWHGKDQLIWPVPYDQIELHKKREGAASFQLFQRKSMDVDGLVTSFVDENVQDGDTYQYRYRNSVTSAVSSLASTGLKYLSANAGYVTPSDVLRYMGNPAGISVDDPELAILCTAYSDALDHYIARYKQDRLWFHSEKITVSMWNVSSDNKLRVTQRNCTPIKQVMQANIFDPTKGKKIAVPKPYLVKNDGMLYFPNLDEADFEDTYQLALELEVGFFADDEIPQDIVNVVCGAIASHLRKEDFMRKFTTASGHLMQSGVAGSNGVKQIQMSKYSKTYFDYMGEVTDTRVSVKALEQMRLIDEDSQYSKHDAILQRYMRTFSVTFL